MRQRVTEFEELSGKTIESAVAMDPQILITFTDGTYAALTTGMDCSEAPELTNANMDVNREIISLATLGIINQEEKSNWLRRRELTDSLVQRTRDEADRREYERLRAKFEK
jgi:hypothetical protein